MKVKFKIVLPLFALFINGCGFTVTINGDVEGEVATYIFDCTDYESPDADPVLQKLCREKINEELK